jgi:acyl-CoA thioester hydrolase
VDRYARTFTVRWSDCDANGHMRNTTYSELAIEVRMAFLTEHGFGHAQMRQHGMGPVILREEIEYLRECHMGEALTVDFTVLGLSPDGARFRMGHEVRKSDGVHAARVVVHGGWLDLASRRMAPPPAELDRIIGSVPRGAGFEDLPPLKR